MKTIIITELETETEQDREVFHVAQMNIKECNGCGACWWQKEKRCPFNDLGMLSHAYKEADEVIFLGKVENGYISLGMSMLLERMKVLYLPHIRYDCDAYVQRNVENKMPSVRFYYKEETVGSGDYGVIAQAIHGIGASKVLVKSIREYMGDFMT